jgi:hypothetical protein
MALWRCSSLYQPTKSSTHRRAASRESKGLRGYAGRYFSVRKSASMNALSSVAAALDCEPYHLLSPADSPTQRPVGRPPASASMAMVAERAEQGYGRQPGSGMHAPTRVKRPSGKRR